VEELAQARELDEILGARARPLLLVEALELEHDLHGLRVLSGHLVELPPQLLRHGEGVSKFA